MKITKKNTAIIISANIKDLGYRWLALRELIYFYRENYNIFIALLLRGVDQDFDNVDLKINKEYRECFTKEKDWNYLIDKIPESIQYVFFSDADCIEVKGQKLLEKSIRELENNQLDGLQCFSDILYLSEYATHKYYENREIINDFNHKKSATNGGYAAGGLLLFRKDWIKKVRFIDYCWLGAGDTLNMAMFVPTLLDENFVKGWNRELIEDIEERIAGGVRFGGIQGTMIHLFHRSQANEFHKLRRMFYGQTARKNINLNEKVGFPNIEFADQLPIYKKYIKKDMTIGELIRLFHTLRENDDYKNPFFLHEDTGTVIASDTYPIKPINKNDISNQTTI